VGAARPHRHATKQHTTRRAVARAHATRSDGKQRNSTVAHAHIRTFPSHFQKHSRPRSRGAASRRPRSPHTFRTCPRARVRRIRTPHALHALRLPAFGRSWRRDDCSEATLIKNWTGVHFNLPTGSPVTATGFHRFPVGSQDEPSEKIV